MKVTSFKNFILRGNVIDLAVGVIIGAAFNKITSSLVQDIVMPPINIVLTKVSFSNWFIVLKRAHPDDHYNTLQEATKAGAITLNIGNFITVLTNFLIIAFCVYLIILIMSKLQTALSSADDIQTKATTRPCPFCCSCVSQEAIKCPSCTSDLPPYSKKQVAINNKELPLED